MSNDSATAIIHMPIKSHKLSSKHQLDLVRAMSVCSPVIRYPPLFTITIHFLLILPFAAPLYFKLSNFNPNDGNITYERASYPANGAIQLTSNQRDASSSFSIGRATYFQPLHLWHNASGNLSDFSTHFTFIINSQNRSVYGDGFAFFLAPAGSTIPDTDTESGSLGLARNGEALNSTDSPFVAVEFDIFKNPWDPEHEHVGIDINSMDSLVNTTWRSKIMEGQLNEALISYNSSSKNLSVVFTGFGKSSIQLQRIYYIVDLRDHLPEWVTFGFSGATGNKPAIHSIYSWEFSSTLGIDEGLLNQTDPGVVLPNPESGTNAAKSKTGVVIGLVIGSILAGGLALALFIYWKRRGIGKSEDDFIIDDEFERGTGPKRFSYNQLAHATKNFSEQEKLGEGGFGGVYRGFLKEMDSFVAVKRVSKESSQGIKEYASEVKIISRLRHRNLVQLVGWCHEKKELLLVYEYMLNGSLDFHLFQGKSLLSWAVRYKIAQGLASALLYLHLEWEQCVVHRDIKSSNIMLDSNFNAKLGDFGLARFVDHEKGLQTTVLAGTMGYMAPECVITGQASRESDVYSFGVVALEIACGRKPIDVKAAKSQVRLSEWVWDLYGTGKLLEAVDVHLSGEYKQQEMERLMIVGLWCVHPDSNLRPSIRQALHVLNFEAPLPALPPKMPVATYFTPSINLPPTSESLAYGDPAHNRQVENTSYSYNSDSSKFTAASASSTSSGTPLFTHDKLVTNYT